MSTIQQDRRETVPYAKMAATIVMLAAIVCMYALPERRDIAFCVSMVTGLFVTDTFGIRSRRGRIAYWTFTLVTIAIVLIAQF